MIPSPSHLPNSRPILTGHKCPELGSPRGGSKPQRRCVGQEAERAETGVVEQWSLGTPIPILGPESPSMARVLAGRIQGEGLLGYLGRPNPITRVRGSGQSSLVRSEKSAHRGSEICGAGFEDGGGGHGPGNEEAGSWKR